MAQNDRECNCQRLPSAHFIPAFDEGNTGDRNDNDDQPLSQESFYICLQLYFNNSTNESDDWEQGKTQELQMISSVTLLKCES